MMGVPREYAMGWYNEDHGQTQILWHTGMVPDFYTYMALLPEQQKGVILFFSANHFMGQLTSTEVGMGMAALIAGDQPAPIQFGVIPWALRGLLLIPALQIVGVALTLRRLRRWRQAPDSHPRGGRKWGLHILLPLIPNLLVALLLIPMLSSIGGFLRLFMPDVSWIALSSDSFAALWIFVRTGLILWTLRSAPVAPALRWAGAALDHRLDPAYANNHQHDRLIRLAETQVGR